MALVKEITGGDTIVSRFLWREFTEWRPQFKLFFGVNHLPVIRGTEHATWRRIRVVPFDIKIKDKTKVIDNFAETVLRPELPGILARMVRACLAWQKDGRRIAIPEAVKQATAKYRSDQDIIGDFTRDECVEGEGLTATAQALYDAYQAWCRRNGHQPLSQKRFGTQLGERGLTKERVGSGRIAWSGIGLRAGQEAMRY